MLCVLITRLKVSMPGADVRVNRVRPAETAHVVNMNVYRWLCVCVCVCVCVCDLGKRI
jgi:hypothetical protein